MHHHGHFLRGRSITGQTNLSKETKLNKHTILPKWGSKIQKMTRSGLQISHFNEIWCTGRTPRKNLSNSTFKYLPHSLQPHVKFITPSLPKATVDNHLNVGSVTWPIMFIMKNARHAQSHVPLSPDTYSTVVPPTTSNAQKYSLRNRVYARDQGSRLGARLWKVCVLSVGRAACTRAFLHDEPVAQSRPVPAWNVLQSPWNGFQSVLHPPSYRTIPLLPQLLL